MDRIISVHKKASWFKEFEYIDLFPYTIAIVMVLAEIYIIHQFIMVTPVTHY
jgi:hypothetical protein